MERFYEEKTDDVLIQNYDYLMAASFKKNAH